MAELTSKPRPEEYAKQILALRDSDSDDDFPGFPSFTDSELDLTLKLLAPYENLEKTLDDLASKMTQSNMDLDPHPGNQYYRLKYAGVDYSRQMLALLAFKATEDNYFCDLEALIKWHDPRRLRAYRDFSANVNAVFESAADMRDISEVLEAGLRKATLVHEAPRTYFGDMLLAIIPVLVKPYQRYIQVLPDALASLDVANPQNISKDLASILNLFPLPVKRLRQYPNLVASTLKLVQSSSDLDKADQATLVSALALLRDLLNDIDNIPASTESLLDYLLSEELPRKVALSHGEPLSRPHPLRAIMVYNGHKYPCVMLLHWTLGHSEYLYNLDLDKFSDPFDSQWGVYITLL
ncbi:hypothetical protein C8F01DRAFT_1249512 [Mycena amicta]|nr:hypothetical protein C8F01DRAFT_1249512 [Mycena amicta]